MILTLHTPAGTEVELDVTRYGIRYEPDQLDCSKQVPCGSWVGALEMVNRKVLPFWTKVAETPTQISRMWSTGKESLVSTNDSSL